jgi:hypothetical protein
MSAQCSNINPGQHYNTNWGPVLAISDNVTAETVAAVSGVVIIRIQADLSTIVGDIELRECDQEKGLIALRLCKCTYMRCTADRLR